MKIKPKQEQLPLLDKITFSDIDIKSSFKNRNKIRDWIREVINNESYKLNYLSFNFCSDEKLLEINQQYLNHDFYTDIITFQLSDDFNIFGDIYISVDRVKDNAKTNNKTYTNELMRVIIHGVLHLCNYKDKTKKDAALMREKEDYYLSLFKNSMFHVKHGKIINI